jgi:hypothetical protein
MHGLRLSCLTLECTIDIRAGRVEFECVWLLDPNTNAQLVVFLPHLKESDVMAKWIRMPFKHINVL